jgi:small subunit ribosomal protein S3
MGNKVHPKAFRLAFLTNWDARWFARKNQFSSFLRQDVEIRSFLVVLLKEALVDEIEIERTRQHLTITIYASKPGFIIGRGGSGIEELKKKIRTRFFKGKPPTFQVNIKEVHQPALSAKIVAQQIAFDIEKRLPFRRCMKQAIEKVMKAGALGVKVALAGRLNGAEIARTEKLAQGKIPMHTLRSEIQFARVAAHTTFGAIGIKIWINRGEIFQKQEEKTLNERMSI